MLLPALRLAMQTGTSPPIPRNSYLTAQTIVKAVLHQARFQDWVNAEEINDQINVFNLRAEQLYEVLKDG